MREELFHRGMQKNQQRAIWYPGKADCCRVIMQKIAVTDETMRKCVTVCCGYGSKEKR